MRRIALLVTLLVAPVLLPVDEAFGLAAPCPAAQAGEERAPVPDSDACAQELEQLPGLYGSRYAQLDNPVVCLSLGREMLADARRLQQDQGNSDGRYVLLEKACELSLRASDIDTAFAAIDQLAATWIVDGHARKVEALISAAPATPASAYAVVADAGTRMAETELEAGDFETAGRLLEAVKHCVEAAPKAALKQRWRTASEVVAAYGEARAAQTVLAGNPDDPEASLGAGWFACFFLGDFAQGLPLLQRSSDAALQRLAQLDLAHPAAPKEQLELGKLWLEWGESQPDRARAQALRRARDWLRQSLPGLSPGLEQLDARKCLERIDARIGADAKPSASQPPPSAPDPEPPAGPDEAEVLAEFIVKERDALRARWPEGSRQALQRLKSWPETRSVTTAASLARAVRPALEIVRDRGLLWLAAHASPDGGWSCASFDDECAKLGDDTVCDGAGQEQHDVGVTGLALLCFLRSGKVATDGPYATVVRRGLQALVDGESNGRLSNANDPSCTYDHIIGTLALLEGLQFDVDGELRASARRAVEHLLSFRNRGAAWRYRGVTPDEVGSPNDTSVTVWAIQALVEARDASIGVDPEALSEALGDALNFLEEMTDPTTGRTGYVERGGQSARAEQAQAFWPREQTEAMTASAVLARLLVDPKRERPGNREMLELGSRIIVRLPPVWSDDLPGRRDYYYWLRGTEALALHGGQPWSVWKRDLTRLLIEDSVLDGERAGSWDPQLDPWHYAGGRIYSTTMLVLAAEAALAVD